MRCWWHRWDRWEQEPRETRVWSGDVVVILYNRRRCRRCNRVQYRQVY